jgi:hypothetical protein
MHLDALTAIMRTLSEILTAGVAITGISLLIYALSFNLRVQVTQSFALMLFCVVIGYTAEALGSIAVSPADIELWQRVQWIGIAVLPASYLHFSDAVLALTGKPSRGRRVWVVRLAYLLSLYFLLLLVSGALVGPLVMNPPTGYLQPTLFSDIFLFYFGCAVALSWFNLTRAYRRATTSASRRRMAYLLVGSLAPAIGAFPFLPYSPLFSSQHPLLFWTLAFLSNLIVVGLIIVMAYSVAFFGVAWPDRVVRERLLKWIMRGPFTASLTLGAVTLVRRGGNVLGWNAEIIAPIVMTASILLCEHLITLLSPFGNRLFFYGNDRAELEALEKLESQLVTRNDLRQFLEMILTAMSDLLQATGGYVIAFETGRSELVLAAGRSRFSDEKVDTAIPEEMIQTVLPGEDDPRIFYWSGDTLFPLYNGTPSQPEFIGLIGVTGAGRTQLDPDQKHSLDLLTQRAAMALRDRRVQHQIFTSLETLTPQVDLFQQLRAVGQYDREGILASEESLGGEDNLVLWVKDALTHYWGGPRLTGSPLLRFRIVQESLSEYDGNQANALRAILRRAILQVRPEGERRFTGEWILYNILDMKFVEGKKVREIAMRLAMSEADLYRKQRVAIEAVARAINEMETQASQQGVDSPN